VIDARLLWVGVSPEKEGVREGLAGANAEEVVEACELNYIDYWRTATSTGEYSERGGIVRCVTGLPQEIFNVVLYSRLDEGRAEASIDEAMDEFRARRIPMIWHVGRTTCPPEVSSLLERRGFPHDYDLIAMAADLASLAPFAKSREIEVRSCDSSDDCDLWAECLASSWDSPPQVSEWMKRNRFFRPGWKGSNRTMYLGLLGGVPSGALMLFTSRDDVVGLQCVGTVAEARRQGVGEALVRAGLADARASGHKAVVVLSTTEGVRLYEKAGFRTFGKLPEHSLYFDRLS